MSEQDEANDDKETSAETSAEASSDSEPRKKRSGAAKGKARSRDKAASLPPSSGGARPLMVGVLALAIGAAGGWFGHDAQAKAKLRAESSAPNGGPAGGACTTWEQKICATSGDQSAACHQAKGAADLLTSGTCERALETMPATFAKLKAARASCDNLVSKLCADLPPGSQACTLVKERTPSFPSDRCQEMLQNYDAVIGELKGLDQQMGQAPAPGMPGMPGMPMGMPPHGGPPGEPVAPPQ